MSVAFFYIPFFFFSLYAEGPSRSPPPCCEPSSADIFFSPVSFVSTFLVRLNFIIIVIMNSDETFLIRFCFLCVCSFSSSPL